MGQEREGRQWTIYASECESEEHFRAKAEQALLDIYAIVYWRGQGIAVTPLRVQHDDGTYRTEGFVLAEVFAPAVKAREPDPDEPDTELTEAELLAGLAPVA